MAMASMLGGSGGAGGGVSINTKLLFKKAADAAQASERLVDTKLNDQFRYFRREFMEAAISAGVTLPLELIEDRTGRFFNFVNSKGPKYLLYIMRTQPESSTIMRCAISLLIVTLVILRRKLPDGANRSLNWTSMISGSVGSWVVEMLADVADGAAVSVCITILMNSKLLIIQELLFSLLGMLINCSDEAALQMLTSPSYQQSSLKELEDRWRKELGIHDASLTIDEKAQIIPEIKPTCLSIVFRIVANNRNHHTIVASCADIVVAMCSYGSPAIARAIAKTSAPKMLSHYLEDTSNSPARAVKTTISPEEALIKQILSSKCKAVTPAEDGRKSAPISPPKRHKRDKATWDALHIMIQFLHRFFRYTSTDATSELVNSVPAEDRRKLIQAQNRIVVAVGALVGCAPDIGNYLYSVPKARLIVQNSAQYYLDSLPTNSGITMSKEQAQAVRNVKMLVDIISDEFQALLRMDPEFAMESLMRVRDGATPASKGRQRMAMRSESPLESGRHHSPQRSGASSKESPFRRPDSSSSDDRPFSSRPTSRSAAASSAAGPASGHGSGKSTQSRGGGEPRESTSASGQHSAGLSQQQQQQQNPNRVSTSTLLLRDLKSDINIETALSGGGNRTPEGTDRMGGTGGHARPLNFFDCVAPAPKLPPRLDALDISKRTPIASGSRTDVSQSDAFGATRDQGTDRPSSASRAMKASTGEGGVNSRSHKAGGKKDKTPKFLADAAVIYGTHKSGAAMHKHHLAPISKGAAGGIEAGNNGHIEGPGDRQSGDKYGDDDDAANRTRNDGVGSREDQEEDEEEERAPRRAESKAVAAPLPTSTYDFKTGEMTLRSAGGGGVHGGGDDGIAMFAGISLDGVGRATPLTAEQRTRPQSLSKSAAGASRSVGGGGREDDDAIDLQNILNLSIASGSDSSNNRHNLHQEGDGGKGGSNDRRIRAEDSEWMDSSRVGK